jgi:hypothetical protein
VQRNIEHKHLFRRCAATLLFVPSFLRASLVTRAPNTHRPAASLCTAHGAHPSRPKQHQPIAVPLAHLPPLCRAAAPLPASLAWLAGGGWLWRSLCKPVQQRHRKGRRGRKGGRRGTHEERRVLHMHLLSLCALVRGAPGPSLGALKKRKEQRETTVSGVAQAQQDSSSDRERGRQAGKDAGMERDGMRGYAPSIRVGIV